MEYRRLEAKSWNTEFTSTSQAKPSWFVGFDSAYKVWLSSWKEHPSVSKQQTWESSTKSEIIMPNQHNLTGQPSHQLWRSSLEPDEVDFKKVYTHATCLLTSSANRFLVFLTRALPIDRCMHVVQSDHDSIATDANRLPLVHRHRVENYSVNW